MSDENKPRDISNVESMVIPNGTTFVIVDVDHGNDRLQIEFSLDGKVMRAWVGAEHFQKMLRN